MIVHHAFPTKDSLLFAYEYGLNSKLNGRYTIATQNFETVDVLMNSIDLDLTHLKDYGPMC